MEKKVKANPPFCLVKVSDPNIYIREKGYWKKGNKTDQETILTLDLFDQAKTYLNEKEDDIIPRLVSGLVIKLSSIHQPIRFKPIFREVVGKTKDGVYVHDVRFKMKVTLSTTNDVEADILSSRVSKAVSLFNKIDNKVSTFFQLAQEEADIFRRFLYFFMVVELHTHAMFKKNYQNNINFLNNKPDRMKLTSKKLTNERQNIPLNLFQKFEYCSKHLWNNITVQDIEDFKTAKTIRNKLVHGVNIQENTIPVNSLEKLCFKILDL